MIDAVMDFIVLKLLPVILIVGLILLFGCLIVECSSYIYSSKRADRENHKIAALGQCTKSTCTAIDDHGGVHKRSSPFVVGETVICRKNCAVPE